MHDHVFTPYQKFVIGVLAFLQFSVILDFTIISPLGAMLMPSLSIAPSQFGLIVSAYAVAAAISGVVSAGFADAFDRKKFLLFFYAGFILGTLLCAIAPSYPFLLMARVVTGVFGGVITSISLAIVADLFPLQVRGRVMGVVQAAFAASQVMGLPLGLFLGNRFGWHAPFLMIVFISVPVGVLIQAKLRPVNAHLAAREEKHPVAHLVATVRRALHLRAFSATMFLALGGFMLMPFASAFSVNNLKISLEQLPWVYLVTGLVSLVAGPWLGRLSDRIGKYRLFVIGTVVSIVLVVVYSRLGPTPLVWVMGINVLLFGAINARMIASQALISAVPNPADRGAFMSVNSSVAQFSGGIAAAIAGLIVAQRPGQPIEHYDTLGLVVAAASVLTIAFMYPVHTAVAARQSETEPVTRVATV